MNPVGETARKDVHDHRLTVLHDHGHYKHLLFKKPGHSEYWFEILTAPGTLTVRGDMGSYVFARETDMIGWFIGSSWRGEPNVDYWAEKCVSSTNGRRGLKEYSERSLRIRIAETINDLIRDEDLELHQTIELRRELEDHLDTIDLGDPRDAQRELAEFIWESHQPFSDCYEWDPYEYTFQFEWTAHTLLIALQEYRDATQFPTLPPTGAPVPGWEDQPELLGVFKALGRDARTQPEYRTPDALSKYTEGVEHALSTLWAKGYRNVSELVSAWNVAGPAPEVHEKAKRHLAYNWPTMHHAITTITTTTKGK